jgi:hypothetical protein
MALLAGTLSNPIIFRLAPPAGIIWQITKVIISIIDNVEMDDGKFGGIAELTNGVVGRANTSAGRLANITNWKKNGDLALDMFSLAYSTKGPGGSYGLRGELVFTEGAYIAELNGDNGEYIDVYVQDDLTDLIDFRVKAQGRIFGA